MPNWCSNVIVIKGTPEALNNFKKTLIDPDPSSQDLVFSFNSTVPRPKNEDQNWYEWNNSNWGTKWDIIDCDIEIGKVPAKANLKVPAKANLKVPAKANLKVPNEDRITIWTNTAWSPPIEWAKNVIAQFDNSLEISIAYVECGMGYWGKYTVDKDGEYDDCHDLEDKDIKWTEDDGCEPVLRGIFKDFYENNRMISLGG